MSDTAPTTQDGTPPPDTSTGQSTTTTSEKHFTQAELDAIVRDRLDRERKKAEDAQRKAAEEIEAQRLKDQNEYRALAEKHEARVHELEPYKERAERYEAALTAQLATQRKDLPTHIIELLDERDPAAQLEWLAKNREVLQPAATNGTTAAGVPATPRPAQPPNREQIVTEKTEQLRRTGGYARF